MESSEIQDGNNESSQTTSLEKMLGDVMVELDKLQAFIVAIIMITDNSPDKTGCIIYILASESSDLCSKVNNTIDLAELNLHRN